MKNNQINQSPNKSVDAEKFVQNWFKSSLLLKILSFFSFYVTFSQSFKLDDAWIAGFCSHFNVRMPFLTTTNDVSGATRTFNLSVAGLAALTTTPRQQLVKNVRPNKTSSLLYFPMRYGSKLYPQSWISSSFISREDISLSPRQQTVLVSRVI